ncbi:MAG: lactate racemase domain-containing protein [Desulfobacterales bacterium]
MPKNYSKALILPPMFMVRQNFEVSPQLDIEAAVDAEWDRLTPSLDISPNARVAVGVGSRGVDNLALVTRKVIAKLKQAGAKPFVIPAMGSHGGATAAGQIEVLAERGVAEQSVGAPIEATMETVFLGTSDEGIPLFLDRLAHEADGIVLINRVKPHTNFIGATESGVMKMLAIGLGNQKGAEHYHRLSLVRSQYEIISAAARALLARSKFLFGVALLENQHHQTCALKMADKGRIEQVESELLKQARGSLPGLPVDQVDLLIVDEMGKDISGQGIDPNVVGRDCCAYGTRREIPSVTRILVRDLTEATMGSALGIGQADFTLKRLVDKIDVAVTAINCLTSCCPEAGRVPLTYDNDRQALAAALMTIRPSQPAEIGIVYIKNTLDLKRMMVSQAYVEQLETDPGVVVEAVGKSLEFDPEGMLKSPFTS